MTISKKAYMAKLRAQVVVVGERSVGEADDAKGLLMKGRDLEGDVVARCVPCRPVQTAENHGLISLVAVFGDLCKLRNLKLAVQASFGEPRKSRAHRWNL